MSSPGVTSCLLLLLLLAAVHSASVGGQSGRAAGTMPAAAPDSSISRTNATEASGDDIVRIEIPKLSEKAEKGKLNESEMDEDDEERAGENEEKEEDEEEEDEGDYGEGAYEGEDDEDEYEDELKTIAESHEAMSKDEATSRNASSGGHEQSEGKLSSVKNFDSHERSGKDTSDEDAMSNEASADDAIEKLKEKIFAELLKKFDLPRIYLGFRAKVKRMPTVKKELSTQKEILLATNETQVPKSLLPSEDPHNRLSGKTDSVRRRSLEGNEAQEEVTLAESLLKFLVRLMENPNGWQRIHKMLANVENDLQTSRSIQDPVKRGYDTTATLSSTVSPTTAKTPRRGPKKSRKKKKKRPRHHQRQTTSTVAPDTSPLLTTTETTTLSTTPHWRLVAERFFSPPWHEAKHEKPKNVAKVRYGIASKPRASVWELQDKIDQQDKPKSTLRAAMSNERTPLLLDFPREIGGQSRPMRFGKVNTYQPLRLQDSREFASLSYDRPADSDRSADYYFPEAAYGPRLRYGPSREFSHRRSENDYQDDLTLRTDNFAYNQEYRPTSREFASSKSWSVPSYKSRPWETDEHAFLMSSGKWPWRQHDDFKYWPERGKYSDRNYWMTMRASEEEDDRMSPTEMDEEWQQQRLPLWTEAGKSAVWPMGKNSKPPHHLWAQADRSVKPYDQSRTAWEKNKNHSELNKKENADSKVVLPKITMKTWNSLTSDPATWPYKLPSAKPWPKDENGKSYNPNADLVKKLGLDKEVDEARSNEKDGRTGRLVFEKEIDSDHPSSKDTTKKKELLLGEPKYGPSMDNRSNYSDYQLRKSQPQEPVKERPSWAYVDVKQPKDWNKPLIAPSMPRNDEVEVWSRKFETTGGQAKTMNPNDDNFSFSHFWKEKSNNSWPPKTKTDLWRTRMKSAPSPWSSKVGENNSWTTKVDNSGWMLKTNKADSWTTRANVWEKPRRTDPWSRSPDELSHWKDKSLAMDNAWSKSNNNGDWSQKAKDNNSWVSTFNNVAAWKSNEDSWPRKPEQSVWQQKMNDDWNIGYGKTSASTWPTRWKQFAYHKVTALPISKPGTTADVSSPKSRNAFVAVSAVSSANYNGNDWRKGDAEETMREEGDNFRLDELDRVGNQIRPEGVERPIYAWKKDGSKLNNGGRVKSNGTDPLENQLESLKQDYWSFKENKIEAGEESTYGETTTMQPATVTGLTTTSQPPKGSRALSSAAKDTQGPQIYQQSLMK